MRPPASDVAAPSRRAGPIPLHVGLGEEWIPPGEATAIETMLGIHARLQERADAARGRAERGQHPKQHGCLVARFEVAPDVPPGWRHGLFRTAATYPAVVRFSNARQRHDALPDAHGLAIKLAGVEGPRLMDDGGDATTQDFVLVDHPVFFMRNVEEGVPLLRAFEQLMQGGMVGRTRVLLRGMLSQERSFQILRAMAAKRPDNPLAVRYWSTTPIRLGRQAVKLAVRPAGESAFQARGRGRDKLRQALVDHVTRRETRLDFLIQAQVHPVTMPVEDPTVAWDEGASPFVRVATLRIPVQACDRAWEERLAQRLSFSPWHGLEEHRPLGGINRARRVLYLALAARRRALHQVPVREPSADEVRRWWTEAVR